ncbi:MAG: PQQ-binding-like beta-propeller repeat protein, partial [Acidobacteria bacterium]|nr:PQQ-binding-like beta-propeller repeat protein [Acidobacteriota bacterium]
MKRKRLFSSGRREFLEGIGAAGIAAACGAVWPMGRALGADAPEPGPADWPGFAYDLHNSRFNSREKTLGPGNVGRLKLKWSRELGAPIQSTPAVIGNTLFIGAWNGQYHALETKTGEIKWRFDAGVMPEPRWKLRDIRSSAQYYNGRIYFGTGEGELHCVDAASGKSIWKMRPDPDRETNISSSPNIYKDRVFIGTSGEHAQIACVDADTGAVRWRFYIVPDRDDGGGSVWTAAAIDEEQNVVYNVTGNPRSFTPPGPLLHTESILANDLETGELLWHYQVRATDPRDLDFSCHPMIFDAVSPGRRGASRHCVGAGNKTAFYTWDRYTGELLWRVMLTNWATQGGPWWNSTAAAYNKVYVISNAINDERDPISSRSLGLSESVTAALHAYTGEIVWWRHNNAMNRAPVCVANGVFYQSLADGSLEAFDAETGAALWKSSMPSTSRGGIVIA